MNARERMVGLLTADGLSAADVSRKIGIPARTVESLRSRPDVRALTEQTGSRGIGPAERLEILCYSSNERTALDAASKLAALRRAEPAAESGECSRQHVDRIWLRAALGQGYDKGYAAGRRAALFEAAARFKLPLDTFEPEHRDEYVETIIRLSRADFDADDD